MRDRRPFLMSVAALALVLGLASTLALFTGVRRFEQNKAQMDFQQRANVRIAAVEQGLSDAVDSLLSTNQLFATIPSVSREQFRKFTRPLLEHYSYIQAFNFHRIISGAELPAYQREMRKRYPNFAVTELVHGEPVPARTKERYQVVDYLEPMKGNETAFGLDASSNPQVADVLQRAVDTGLPSATDLFWLAQGGTSQRGFLVLMPVYRYGSVVDSVEARRAAVIGDTAAVFRVADLIDKFFTAGGLRNAPDIVIRVYASATADDRNLVYDSDSGIASLAAPSNSLWPRWLFYLRAETVSRNIEVAGKPWHIAVSSAPAWFDGYHSGSLLILIAGIFLTLLAAAYLHSISARAQRIQQMVDRRTAELKQANQWLTEDIAARERTEQALKLRERAIEASANAILIIRASVPAYPIEYVNSAFERMTGYSVAETLGRNCGFLWDDDADQADIEEIRRSLQQQRECHVALRSYRKDGTLFWSDLYLAPVKSEDGAVSHFVVAMYDITSTKRYEAELEFQAKRDILTGLANRHLLRDRLQQAIAYADRHPVSVVLLDLDRFKFVNDTLGHKAGDQLLHQLAARLLSATHDADTVARLGADEFVVIMSERSGEMRLTHAVQRIMDAVSEPLVIEGHEFFLTCSTGVATYPTDGSDADVLLKHAEVAMYRAKELGRNNFQLYTPAMNAQALERLRIEGNLRTAVERGEFVLHYQPQLDLRSGRVVGMEALIRWDHPELGMVAPARFIGLAEETGLIVPIGAWVTRTACRQTKAWQQAGLGMLRVAVNLSARQFYQQDLVQSIAAILDESALEAGYLEIELTEGLVMTDVERAIEILSDLKALGVKISIDDFGTGYSSLSYLKRFPIDVLKIDQSFVRDITINPDDAAIVVSIISLAHSLRLQVIAEGVETQEQLTYLREHECDQMQGYYFSRPLAADAFADLLKQDKGLPSEIRRITA